MKSHLHITINDELKRAFSTLCKRNDTTITAALSVMMRAELARDQQQQIHEVETFFSTFPKRQ